jgi:hypothetical protein
MPPAALAIWLLCAGVDAGAGATIDADQASDAGDDAGAIAAPPAPEPPTPPPTSSPSIDAGAAPVAPAPLASLEGTVFEKGTRHRLAGASVTIDAISSGETDESGSFVAALSPGRHVVEIQLPGFDLVREPVDVAGPVTHRTWRLLRRLEDRRYQTIVSPPGQPPKIALSGEEARTTPGAAGDPFRSIESLPGVAQVAWPLALYAIRGANPGNTGFFIDGMRVPALFHFALGPSVVHPYLIDRLDFYPGGPPARFGGYVSGAVAADLGAPPNDLAHASVDLRVYDVGGLVTTPFDQGRGTLAIAGRYSYTAALAGLLFSDVQLGYADYQVRLEHPLAGGRLTLLAMGSADELALRVNAIGDGALQFHRIDLRWDRALGPGRLRLRGTVGTDWARSNLRDDPISIRAYSAAPRIEYGARLAAAAQLDAGVSLEAQRFRPAIPPMPDTSTLDDLARPRGASTAAAYVSLALSLGARLELSPGVRLVRYAEQGVVKLAPEPRLNARWALSERIALKGSVGRYTQMASLPVGVPGFDAFDLRDLGLQRSTQSSLGATTKLGTAAELDVTGFYQQLQVTDLRSTFSADFRVHDFLEMRPGRGYGVELLLRRPDSERLHGWLAYTLSRSERQVDGVWGASDWDQRHILNLLLSYRLGRGYSVGGRIHYNSGRPFAVPLPGNSSDVEYRRLPPFYQLDLRADKRMVFDRFTLTAYLDLGNVTLTREVTALSSTFHSDGTPIYDGSIQPLGYRIVLPSLGLRGEL